VNPDDPCPLTPALLALLQAAIDHETTDSEHLAEILCSTPKAIGTKWERAIATLGVHNRGGAIARVLRHGWVTPSPRRR